MCRSLCLNVSTSSDDYLAIPLADHSPEVSQQIFVSETSRMTRLVMLDKNPSLHWRHCENTLPSNTKQNIWRPTEILNLKNKRRPLARKAITLIRVRLKVQNANSRRGVSFACSEVYNEECSKCCSRELRALKGVLGKGDH